MMTVVLITLMVVMTTIIVMVVNISEMFSHWETFICTTYTTVLLCVSYPTEFLIE